MKKRIKLLIVDDNMNFVDRIINLLEEVVLPEAIIVASDFEEARKLFSYENPHIVLLDINLPGKNGIEFLKHIRQNDEKCEVIMITNHADEYYRELCFGLGAKHFLDKSNDFAQVPAIVREYNPA